MMKNRTEGYWGRRAPFYLMKDWNWALASLEVFQNMIEKPEVKLLKSCTGLEGGVVATGSTCGVVSGGAIGLALSHYDEIMEKGIPAQIGLLAVVGEITCSGIRYISLPWFSSHSHFSTAIAAWSLANSINLEHLLFFKFWLFAALLVEHLTFQFISKY